MLIGADALRIALRFAYVNHYILKLPRNTGGVSVALAPTPERDAVLTACYGIVVFTMVVRGLTLSRLARKLFPEGSIAPDPLNSVWRER